MTQEERYNHYYNEGYNAGSFEGYEQGYEDAINKACEWLEETFKDGEVIAPLLLVQLKDKFRKAMKGE